MRVNDVYVIMIFIFNFLRNTQLNARSLNGDQFGKLFVIAYECLNYRKLLKNVTERVYV